MIIEDWIKVHKLNIISRDLNLRMLLIWNSDILCTLLFERYLNLISLRYVHSTIRLYNVYEVEGSQCLQFLSRFTLIFVPRIEKKLLLSLSWAHVITIWWESIQSRYLAVLNELLSRRYIGWYLELLMFVRSNCFACL